LFKITVEIMRTIGIVLIVLGAFALIYSGFTFNTEEKVVDLGPIKVEKEKKHSLSWPPIAGFVLIIGGGILMLTNKKGSIIK
jgi:drug/metabolite transporter (DMT)-like permease